MTQLRVGVIGIGRMGTVHAKHLVGGVSRARLVALSDVNAERLSVLSDELGVKAYRDYRELLHDPDVDAIVIAGPTDQRESMLTHAFSARKPIFCEKPLSLTLEGVVRLKEIAERENAFLQIGFMRRFDPGYAMAKRMIQQGRIGQVIGVHSKTLDPRLAPYEYIAASGGIFADLAIHDFDIARFLMDDEVESVYTVGGVYKYERLSEYDDIDNCVCTLRFSRGGFGTIHGSRNAVYGYDVRAEVYGTEGSIRIGYDRETPVLLLTEGGGSHDYVPFFIERFQDAYRLEIEAFVAAVLDGQPSPVGIHDGEMALMIAEAAKRSYRSGQPEAVTTAN